MSDQEEQFSFFKKATGQDTDPRNTAADDDEPYALPPLQSGEYTAFRLSKRQERMLIARASQPMRFPAYHELRDISFDQAHQQGFFLFYQAMTVEVLGKNLWPVVHAIANGRCAALYEYHAKLYPAPPAKGEPLIESMKLLPPETLADDVP